MNFTFVVKRTKSPLNRIADPVTAKGRKNPPASYRNAPITGPMVSPKLNAASHHALKNLAIQRSKMSGNMTVKI